MNLNVSAAKKDFLNTFFMVVIYCLAFYGLQIFLYNVVPVWELPTEAKMMQWDSGWYKSIADNGYQFSYTQQNNTGFYYLFPLIWKISHLGTWGISILNILFLATGLSILSGMYKLTTTDKLLWLSIPTIMFAMVPYSEAIFFLLTTLCFLGIVKNKRWLVWVSLFLISLTRATAVCLLPAFLIMELISTDKANWLKALLTYITDYALPLLAGLGTFILIQYMQTGIWFAYFYSQNKFWNRIFGIPSFPLNSPNGFRNIWLSALAIFSGFICLLFLIKVIVQWLWKDKKTGKILALSLGYLAMSLFIILFFNPQWSVSTTDVMGAFRYIMMTPFFYIFLNHFTRNRTYTWKHYALAFLLTNLVWFAFGSYNHIQHFLYFTTNTLMIGMYMLHTDKKLQWPAIVLIALNILFQILLFQQYFSLRLPD